MRTDAEDASTSLRSDRKANARRWFDAALILVAALAIAGWLFLSVAHARDRYHVLHVQGAWMTLARDADDGILYPPLYDGEHYGGTRWMPVPILLNAGAAKLTGEYLTSGKIVGLVSTALLLVLVFSELRRLSAPFPAAAALTASIVATETGLFAGTTVGGDVVPVVLQIGALMIARSGTRRSLVAAGALAALALASKTTGVWAALAILTWLALARRWRDVALFFAIVQTASQGRFTENLALLTLAGVGGGVGPIRAPNQLLYQMYTYAAATWLLVPFAVASVLFDVRWRRPGMYDLALGWAVVLLIVTYTDVGAGLNQLLDVSVLTVIVAGHLAGRTITMPVSAVPLGLVLTLAIVWGVGNGVLLVFFFDVTATTEGRQLGYPVKPLANIVGPGEEILSEDPYVPLSMGRDPVVLDPFMLLRLDRVDPAAVDELIQRIEDKRFAYLVMITSLDRRNDYWWDQFHFGLRIVDAMRDAYVEEGRIDRYYIYRPAP